MRNSIDEATECKIVKIEYFSVFFLIISTGLFFQTILLLIGYFYPNFSLSWMFLITLSGLVLISLSYSILTELLFLRYFNIKPGHLYLFLFFIVCVCGYLCVIVITLMLPIFGFMAGIFLIPFLLSKLINKLKDMLVRNNVPNKDVYEIYKKFSLPLILGKSIKIKTTKAKKLRKYYEKIEVIVSIFIILLFTISLFFIIKIKT